MLVSNAEQNRNTITAAALSFRGCDSGSYTNYTADVDHRCVLCRPGTASAEQNAQQQCVPCTPVMQRLPGSSACEPCREGFHANAEGSTVCVPCTGNRWQLNSAQALCSECELGKYKVMKTADNLSSSS